MSEQGLSEQDLRIMFALKTKSVSEVAREFSISEARVRSIANAARTKTDRLSRLLSNESLPATAEVAANIPFVRVFRLEKRLEEPQTGTMKVGSQILELLSKGIYSAPENAIKELLSNAHDADAENVTISADPDGNRFVITDDGEGMDYIDFDEHFTFISRSTKRDEGPFTKRLGRPIIGKIGIGFIAVSELCGKMKVVSAKKGSDTWFEATIDFARYRTTEARKKEFYELSQFELVNHQKEDPKEHYTRIELTDLNSSFTDILLNKTPGGTGPSKTLEGNTMEDLVEMIKRKRIKNIMREAGPYWRFVLNLSSILPVEYVTHGPIKTQTHKREVQRILDEIVKQVESLGFRVTLNGLQLKKPILLPTNDSIRLEGRDFDVFPIVYENYFDDGSRLKVKGYVYNQRMQILPEDWRGLVTRIKNTSIGGPDQGFWDHPYPGDKLYLPQTYGEIYVEDGLEQAMNIDRSTFKSSHPHYQTLKRFLNERLRKTVFDRAKDRWSERRMERMDLAKSKRQDFRRIIMKQAFGRPGKLVMSRKSSDVPLQALPEARQIVVYTQHALFEDLNKQTRDWLIDVLMAFEAALLWSRGDIKKLRTIFWKNVARASNSL